jgi:signal transduction histidine kinase
VRLEIRGDLATVPPGQARAAYRIVQEALTNAGKHGSRQSEALVGLTVDAGRLRIEVRNPVADSYAPGSGLGLLGMRERVEIYSGSLRVGLDLGWEQTWTVRAELPLAAEAAAMPLPVS